MKIYSNVKLNVSQHNVLKGVFAKQLDSNSRYLDCALFAGRKMLMIDRGDIVVNAERADGNYRSFAGSINSNGTVRIPLTNWMLGSAGTLSCSVTIYDGNEKLTTASFELDIQKTENPTGTVSPDDPNVDLAEQLVERCEAAVLQIETEFAGAGVHGVTYTTIFDTATVTTEQSSMYPSFHALLMDGREASRMLEYDSDYRITIDDVEYILPAQGWYVYALKNNVHTSHDIVVIGNVSLWGSDIGFYTEIADVPFFITPQTGEVEDYGIHLFTSEGGQHTVKIEKLTYNKTVFPNVLMYGGVNPPIYSMHGVPEYKDYNSLSIGGFNDLRAKRTTVAIGSKNIISGENGIALGELNNVGGICAVAAGIRTSANNYASMSVNEGTTASGRGSFSANIGNTASADASSAFGNNTEASGPASVAFGTRSIANHLAQFVFGRNNVADPSQAASSSLGTYVEIVGNGTSKNARSNARTLDWSGNESLAGSITLGKGTEDEVTLTAAQLKRLIALLS